MDVGGNDREHPDSSPVSNTLPGRGQLNVITPVHVICNSTLAEVHFTCVNFWFALYIITHIYIYI